MNTETHPSTLAEWHEALEASSSGELMVILTSKDRSGRPLPGSKLLGFKGQLAVVQPAGHRRHDHVEISTLKLDRKANHKRAEIEKAGKKPTRKSLREPDELWVVRYPETKKYLRGRRHGQWDVYGSLDDARRYLNKDSAKNANYGFVHTQWGKRWNGTTIEVMTVADARKVEEQLAAEKTERDRLHDEHVAREKAERSAAAAALAKAIVDKELGAPAEADLQPEATPAPVAAPFYAAPTQQTVPGVPAPYLNGATEVFERWRAARVDEAEAKALLLEAQGRREREEANIEIERMRRSLAMA